MIETQNVTFARTTSRRSPLRVLRTVFRLLRSYIHQDQVAYKFPTYRLSSPHPFESVLRPKGYSVRTLDALTDYSFWIALLNMDAGFGTWDLGRLRDELVGKLIAPDAAAFLFKGEKMVGAIAICYTRFAGKHVPSAMYLIIDPECRGQYKLLHCLFVTIMGIGAREGHDYVFATTFPDRLPALAYYLAYGAMPCYVSLSSFMQWAKIRKRLGPTIERVKKRLV